MRKRAHLGKLAHRALARRSYETLPVNLTQKLFAWLTCWLYHPAVHPIFTKIKAGLRG